MVMAMNRQLQQFQKAYESDALETKVLGATPLELIVLLYEGAIEALQQAQQAIRVGNVPLKGKLINKASDILEGLRAALNYEKGGDIATSLNDLYQFAKQKLTDAHRTNSEVDLQSVVTVLETLLGGWKHIAREQHVKDGEGAASHG
jgi:flagellar protein FliS